MDYKGKMELALYQPDIPQNTGAMLRTAACLGVPVHIIEPCGFPFSDKGLRRSGMDYVDLVDLTTHLSWNAFEQWRQNAGKRLVLLTTKGHAVYTDFTFQKDDILMVGRESKGVPEDVHMAADARLRIPLREGARSLNVGVAAAMVLGESLRQLGAV